ncbi:hypothetical protein B9Z19DRAFT_1197521 [Tuber borchii]|uniref:Uncharacterized protein n=1 Tax=Tuber borchii TaxID=42251 RepID=A0A2T6ZAK6_TUBBO|nr:hypothetical protein B9Z19DRAFT_1197521 [Tuber borchii]
MKSKGVATLFSALLFRRSKIRPWATRRRSRKSQLVSSVLVNKAVSRKRGDSEARTIPHHIMALLGYLDGDRSVSCAFFFSPSCADWGDRHVSCAFFFFSFLCGLVARASMFLVL